MICIEERIAKQAPGNTSFFVSFNYHPDIVNALKMLDFRNYDEKTHEWEISIAYIDKVIDALSTIDDINIKFLPYIEPVNKNFNTNSIYKTQPYRYQLEAIDYGLNHDNWLLLDSMGLGKTLTAIYIAQERKKLNNIKHCLIICGVNSVKFNWKKEIEKHSDLDAVILGEKKTKKGRTIIGSLKDRIEHLKNPIKEFFIITNIETIRSDEIVKILNRKKTSIDMIIVDEIHACKSQSSCQGANLLKLKADYKMGMSGTLLLNNPLDVFVPLKFIDAESCNLTNYKAHYCVYNDFRQIIGYKNLNLLKYILGENSLRRKKDILELPPKVVIPEYIEMSDKQRLFYENIEKGITDQADKVEISNSCLLSMVIRLRQATSCPEMLTSEDISSAKIDRACELADDIIANGHKVVIFSSFIETVKQLEKRLKNKYKIVTGTGEQKDKEVSDNVDAFQENDDIKVFVGTWQKCGTGLTLTAASYMIFLDTPWTFGLFEQSCDRIYRIGTKNKVFIYNLIAKDTIDERVLEILNTKSALADFIIDDEIISQTALDSLRKYIQDLTLNLSQKS